MATETRLLTAEEFWQRPGPDKWTALVRGEVRTMAPPGGYHAVIQAAFSAFLYAHARAHGGEVLTEGGFVLSHDPDTVRTPDVAYVRPGRVPRQDVERFWPGAPDLAVEVVSPHDTAQEIEQKVQEYLAAGSSMVLVVHPQTRTVTAYRPDGSATVLRPEDTFDGGDVFPGLSFPLAEVFRRPGT